MTRRAGIQSSLTEGRPRRARGIIPLILGAMAVGKGIYGAISANQVKKRNEGYIEENYRASSERLKTTQADARQNTAESLNARGLLGMGAASSPILRAMQGGGTIGTRLQADNETQFGLERKDLDQQRERALQDNSDARTNAYIGNAFSAVQGGLNAYGASQDLGEMGKMDAAAKAAADAKAAKPSRILSAMQGREMKSIDQPHNWFGGVVGYGDPLTHPLGSWNEANHGTITSQGESNATFNVG